MVAEIAAEKNEKHAAADEHDLYVRVLHAIATGAAKPSELAEEALKTTRLNFKRMWEE